MQDVTVNDGWHKITFHSEDGNSEYHKVMWGRLGYGNWDRVDDRLACGDTFEPAICMTVTEHDALNADRARLVAQIEQLTRELSDATVWGQACDDVASELIEVLKLVYRKHIASDPAIGWDELSEKVLDALSNAMGVEELVKWQEATGNE